MQEGGQRHERSPPGPGGAGLPPRRRERDRAVRRGGRDIGAQLPRLAAGDRRAGDPGQAVTLLLLQISEISLVGARLGVQRDFAPREKYQPDVGPDADLDSLRLRLAGLLGNVDTMSYVFDPYQPEVVESQLSDDVAGIASDLELGLRHYRSGDVEEALWWWQFSYVSSWGTLAGAAMKALLSVVAHDRLDVEIESEHDQIEAAAAALDGGGAPA
ncbi:DUF5063 domain-containing protein [Nocardioides sp. TF02-7]|uniref:DUF5063 domain-containing protein n=1 Tax=Nocardioides sp. TF02-7 TaxID=2917724 RepID=UPI001F06BED8|nr:DUF5063 domain-containing protein [Nocardioides sp. TF02-7]UMG94727.1 DUF5063 domain-containing protein [Nocardioides sp. TF02-7]